MSRLIVFILVYLGIYGGVHVYAYRRLQRGLLQETAAEWIVAVFMVLMVAAPIATRVIERYGHDDAARLVAWAGYLWMGCLFVFVTAVFCFDVYRAAIWFLRFATSRDLVALIPSFGFACKVSLITAVAVMSYGFFEARNLRLERVVIASKKIRGDTEGIRVAQISDIHLGIIVGRHRLQAILDQVRAAKPDILVSTGDLVDGQMDSMQVLADMFQMVHAPLGKFAVTGNHEFYAGLEKSLRFTEDAGFKVLRGEGLTLERGINIVGVDDPARPYRNLGHDFEKELLAGFPRDRFTIYLKHQPVIDPGTLGLFDLQLSGHTHKGQIFPFNLATKLFYKMHTGLSGLEQGSWLYVSRGSGTWGPPARFLSPPEVTLIEIVPERP